VEKMKNTNSLAEQILKAQEVYNAWPDSRKSSLRLEGADIFMSKTKSNLDVSPSKSFGTTKAPKLIKTT